jgi:hypothetical protein
LTRFLLVNTIDPRNGDSYIERKFPLSPIPSGVIMTSSAARKAFDELGYGDKERAQGLPKLDFLAHHDPELLQAIVEQCKGGDPQIVEMWRSWFESYPAKIINSGHYEDHLGAFKMRYHLLPVALMVRNRESLLTVEALMGSAWQFMERTGSFWDTGKAFMIVVTLMPSGFTTSSSAEGIQKIKYVASHIDEVIELIPEIIAHKIIDLRQLETLVEERFPHDEDTSEETSATLDA